MIRTQCGLILCRRFLRLLARLLSLKQDKISLLEKQLDDLDQKETCPFSWERVGVIKTPHATLFFQK